MKTKKTGHSRKTSSYALYTGSVLIVAMADIFNKRLESITNFFSTIKNMFF